MLDRSNKSSIIGLSSVVSYFPFPGNMIYSSSKAYVQNLFLALGYEMKNDSRIKKKIDVLTYAPGTVYTKINGYMSGPGSVKAMYASRCALMDVGKTDLSFGVYIHYLTAVLI